MQKIEMTYEAAQNLFNNTTNPKDLDFAIIIMNLLELINLHKMTKMTKKSCTVTKKII